MIRRIKIKKGLDIPITGAPKQSVIQSPDVKSVGIPLDDYFGLKPELLIAVGDRVKRGQALFRDRNQQDLLVTAPASGWVRTIDKNEKQRLSAIEIECDGRDDIEFDACMPASLPQMSTNIVREKLLNSGLWTAFRARPFGHIPGPKTAPLAIYVTAIDTQPLAVDPVPIIETNLEAFEVGLTVVARLTEGPVHICTAKALPLTDTADIGQIRQTVFIGPHPAGLVGTHIHYLTPLRREQSIWYIHYQDVIAIGKLFSTGYLSTERIISLAGPSVKNPRLVSVPSGANISDVTTDELVTGDNRIISGSVLAGNEVSGAKQFLGRYHWQISVLNNKPKREFLGWIKPGIDRFSATRLFLSNFFVRRSFDMTTALNGSPRAMIPIGSYENVMPLELLITPLLKALLVNDTETAKTLGCLGLEEEDLALCSFVCCSKYDFGAALRDTLNTIEKTG